MSDGAKDAIKIAAVITMILVIIGVAFVLLNKFLSISITKADQIDRATAEAINTKFNTVEGKLLKGDEVKNIIPQYSTQVPVYVINSTVKEAYASSIGPSTNDWLDITDEQLATLPEEVKYSDGENYYAKAQVTNNRVNNKEKYRTFALRDDEGLPKAIMLLASSSSDEPFGSPAEWFEYSDGTITAFSEEGKKHGNIVIPSEIDGITITKIEYYALQNNPNLLSVYIPDTVTEIAEGAFASNTNLVSINFSDSVEVIESSVLSQCNSLKTVILPSSVTQINDYAFDFSALTSFTIPSTVKNVGSYIFDGCENLKTVTIESKDTVLSDRTFSGKYGCENLETIYYPGDDVPSNKWGAPHPDKVTVIKK